MKLFAAVSLFAALVSGGSIGYWAYSRPVGPPPETGTVHVSEPVVDLGRVGLNQTVGGSFAVVNDSPHAITFGQIAKSCACTTAELSVGELPPGGRAEVKFQVRTGDRRGGRLESVAVPFRTTPGEPEELVFAKVAFVPTGVIDVDTPEVVLTRRDPKAVLTLVAAPAALKQVLRVESQNRCVEVDTSRLPKVVLELDETVPSESIVNTECVIYTSVPGEDVVRVPVRVRK